MAKCGWLNKRIKMLLCTPWSLQAGSQPSATTRHGAIVVPIALTLCLLAGNSAHAWSLRTHMWVAQQVFNDIVDDCHITLKLIEGSEKTYPVRQDTCDAIRANPKAYRAGSLGPDAFPDLVVGQMTAHPGVDGGWQADQWINHLLQAASSPQEIAFAYGFVSHAAGDVFAHSYVNHYAGDIFTLSDNESAVELRHFTLEKYIEGKTPALMHNGNAVPNDALEVPKRFLSQNLIYNEGTSRQYIQAKFGIHLSALHTARGAVVEASNTSQKIIDRILELLAKYYELQAQQLDGFKGLELNLEAAKLFLKGAEEALQVEAKILDAKRKFYEIILSTIEKYPELILGLGTLIDEQLRLGAHAADQAAKVQADLNSAQGLLNKLQGDLAGVVARGACDLIDANCRNDISKICDLPGSCPALGTLCCATKLICDRVKPADCQNLEAEVSSAVQAVLNLEGQLKEWAAQEAAAQARKAALEAEKLEKTLALEAARLGRQAAELELQAQEELVKLKQDVVAKAKEAVEYALAKVKEAGDALNVTKILIEEIEEFAQRYNWVSLYFANWIDGLDRAGDDYIQAGLDSSLSIIQLNGNALDPYTRWLQCSLLTYVGVPWQLPYALCEVKDKVDELRGRLEELKESLPPILQWAIDPLGELREEVMKKAKPELWKAAETSADFVLGPPTGRFIHFLADPKLVTAQTLRDSFNQSDGGKQLIRMPRVVEMVNRDIGFGTSGLLDPERFHALRNSVVLAKLSLLDTASLNQLYREFAGNVPTRYGPTLYDEARPGRFSLLLDAVRSIDGNHQWQPFGIPYPREGEPQPTEPEKRHYGHSVHQEPHLGLRLFADPTAREQVFNRIFSGPIEGELLALPQMKYPPYKHPACEANPFPRTVSDNGSTESHDLNCLPNYHPAKWFDKLGELLERLIYRFKSFPKPLQGELAM